MGEEVIGRPDTDWDPPFPLETPVGLPSKFSSPQLRLELDLSRSSKDPDPISSMKAFKSKLLSSSRGVSELGDILNFEYEHR